MPNESARTPLIAANWKMHKTVGEAEDFLDRFVGSAFVGPSERRAMFGETDEALARKFPALLAAGLEPILCVGETEAERDADETEAVLERQVAADLAAVA